MLGEAEVTQPGARRPAWHSIAERHPIFTRILFGLALLTLVRPDAVTAAEPSGLIAHWLCAPNQIQGSGLKALLGGPNVSPSNARFLDDPPPARVELNGRTSRLVVAEDLSKARLPKEAFSVEAWVRVDQPLEWGGLFGVIQDNGDAESGWLLGYRGSAFCFALAGERGDGRLTYLRARDAFVPGRWYHVVGTYDGREQRLYVDGAMAARDTTQSGPIRYPARAPVVIGAYQDDDEHYRLTGALHEVLLYQRALSASEIAARHSAKASWFPEPAPEPLPLRPAYGPWVDWQDRRSAVVSWETDEPMPTALEWEGPDGTPQRLGDPTPATQHVVVLSSLKPDTEYFYRLRAPDRDGRAVQSQRYLFDTSFHYAPRPVPPQTEAVAAEDHGAAAVAARLLDRSGVRHGYCLVLGATDGRLALELVRQSDLKVVVADADEARIRTVRRLLDRAGVYGVRATAMTLEPGPLPFGDYLANLVVSERPLADGRPPEYPAIEIARIVRPSGGTILLGVAADGPATPDNRARWTDWLGAAEGKLPGARLLAEPGIWVLHRRAPLAGAGEWTHQYGSADNTSCSQDELVRGELQVGWWGDPGPRPMPDRGPRNPAPLSVNGRLFIQGDRVVFGVDAYNGTILWTRSAPELRRANIPRDCSNMAAAGDRLYLAQGRYCVVLDGDTGRRVQRYAVADSGSDRHDWGYLALVQDSLVGSRVRAQAEYLGDDGEWYEDFHPDQVSRVTSDRLFGRDPQSGQTLWEYEGGAILNSTIAIGDSMIFFVESRAPAAVAAAGLRQTPEALTDTHLVALDLRSGRQLWTRAQDFTACQYMTYLVYSRNTVVVTGTDRDKVYHTYAFNAPSPAPAGDVDPLAAAGQVLWSESHKEDKGHHSGHLQHPVVIDDVFYSDQRAFNLVTGELVRKDLPERRGCGTMSAARHAIFYRHYFHGMWDLESDQRTQFEGVRSGCWLSLIPAGGMLLGPETSAGCSCTHPIQTSVAFLPKSRLP